MDLYFVLPALFGMFTLVLSAGLPAPPADPPSASEPHLRTKRCSCASFLDKECVYFCHLDIIWVNTPERVVVYGLGNAPRARRSLPVRTRPQRTRPRCRCLRDDDYKCNGFCRRQQRHGRPDPASSPVSSTVSSPVSSPASSPEPRGRWILEKRRLRRRWDAQSSAS